MRSKPVFILGAGPAGLSMAYYLHKKGIPFKVVEGSDSYGGNAKTFEFNGHRYDSGAHRFHDKIDDITQDIKEIVGSELRHISAPSQIYSDGKFINFPLSPTNLLKTLGVKEFTKAGFNVLKSKLSHRNQNNFHDMVVGAYGKNMANRFLIPYSEKLWGLPAHQLSNKISGGRLKGLNLGAFFIDSLKGKKAKHLDGSFYYPKHGIGQINDRIVDMIGADKVILNSKVTKINLDNNIVRSIQINDQETIEVDQLVSSLPINILLSSLSPEISLDLKKLTNVTNYRNVLLVSIQLNLPSITDNASIYFPDNKYLFTRIVEPKNRSSELSPNDQTLLVLEIPYSGNVNIEGLKEEALYQLFDTNLINKANILDIETKVLYKAYPVLKLGYERDVRIMNEYLSTISNLIPIGRNGHFTYTHIHDLFAEAKDIVTKMNDQDHF